MYTQILCFCLFVFNVQYEKEQHENSSKCFLLFSTERNNLRLNKGLGLFIYLFIGLILEAT